MGHNQVVSSERKLALFLNLGHPQWVADAVLRWCMLPPAKSRNPQPLVTAAVLASVFCLYYFVYLAAQREYHTNRNFRSLAVLGGRRSSDPDCICGATTVAGSWR